MMRDDELVEKVREYLLNQLGLYERLDGLQGELMCMREGNRWQEVIPLLETKNALLDQLREKQKLAVPLLDLWNERKAETETLAESSQLNDLVDALQTMALKIKQQDESMLRKLDFSGKIASEEAQSPDRRSRDVINAFRALR